jgi:hypothetical protein
MKALTNIIIVLFLFMSSCNSHQAATLDYSKLTYDSSKITILKWDTLSHAFSNNSDPLPLSQADLQLVDSLLRQAIDSFNKQQSLQISKVAAAFNFPLEDSMLFFLDINHFKIEYVPYIDVNFYHVVEINCLCDGSEKSNKYQAVWRKRNFCHFQLAVELKQRKSSTIWIDYFFG